MYLGLSDTRKHFADASILKVTAKNKFMRKIRVYNQFLASCLYGCKKKEFCVSTEERKTSKVMRIFFNNITRENEPKNKNISFFWKTMALEVTRCQRKF